MELWIVEKYMGGWVHLGEYLLGYDEADRRVQELQSAAPQIPFRTRREGESSTGWRFDVQNAPKDVPVILASPCGKVAKSRWVEEKTGGRWEFYTLGQTPVAFMIWPTYPSGGASS